MNATGCLMVQLDMENWTEFVDNIIDKNDIYDNETNDYGIEYEPHITILYGLDVETTTIEQLKKYTIPSHILQPILFLNISTFENEEFDVVKFNVLSPQLNRMNSLITKNLKYENSYLNYQPHCTLAYVKKGMGKKYAMDLRDKDFTALVKEYKYSSPNNEPIYWKK